MADDPATPEPMRFNNGMTVNEANEVYDLQIEISRLALRVEQLGRHRSYSLVITKLDEAKYWLGDRFHRAA